MKRRPHRTPSHFSAPATQRHVPRNQDHASCEPHVKTHSPPDPVPGCPTPFPSPANIVVHPIKFHPRLQPRVGLQHICLALAPPHSQPPIFFNLQNRPDFLTGETRATPHLFFWILFLYYPISTTPPLLTPDPGGEGLKRRKRQTRSRVLGLHCN